MWNLNNKTIVISGATNGIGKAAAIELSKENPKLLFTYRNQSLADELLAEIKDISPNTQVQSVYCDFSDQDSIKKCTNEINDLCANIDVLINNAGVVNTSYHETGEGIENTFAVNHLGYFLFTNLLLQKLKGHDETRIVNVSSAAHSFVKEMQWEDINFKNNFRRQLDLLPTCATDSDQPPVKRTMLMVKTGTNFQRMRLLDKLRVSYNLPFVPKRSFILLFLLNIRLELFDSTRARENYLI